MSGGMKGMLGTIWLIICAMVFGGIMDAVGALVCGMGRFFLLQWHSPAGISDIVDIYSKSGACCSGIIVPDQDAG